MSDLQRSRGRPRALACHKAYVRLHRLCCFLKPEQSGNRPPTATVARSSFQGKSKQEEEDEREGYVRPLVEANGEPSPKRCLPFAGGHRRNRWPVVHRRPSRPKCFLGTCDYHLVDGQNPHRQRHNCIKASKEHAAYEVTLLH